MQNNRYEKSDSFPLPFQGLINGRGMMNYKHHDHREKKCKNSHTRVGKTTELWRMEGPAFAPTFAWV